MLTRVYSKHKNYIHAKLTMPCYISTCVKITRCPYHKFAASPAAARLDGLGGYKARTNR